MENLKMKREFKRDYLTDSIVDKFNLDFEYENSASVYMEWAEMAVDAHINMLKMQEKLKLIKAECKNDLDKKRAEVDSIIRTFPERYGFDKKPTEAGIASTILLDEGFESVRKECIEKETEATNEYIKAVEQEKILEEAKRAMSIKKSSIEGLERLFLKDYYPRSSKEGLDKRQDGKREEISQKINEEVENDLKTNRIRRRKVNK